MLKTKMWDEIQQQSRVFRHARDFNERLISELVEQIKVKDIKGVIIAARGSSSHAGMFAKYLFEIYAGIPVTFASPSVITKYNSKIKLKDYLVLAISQSGAGLDVLEVVRAGNECGAITVAITNTLNSIIATTANYHLYCNCQEELSVAATKTFMMQLYLSTLLVAKLTENKQIFAALDSYLEVVDYGISLQEEIAKLAKDFIGVRDLFVLSRGLSYPIALEAALKIKETCYIHASGYALSEFVHGPFAVLDQQRPVIIYALDQHVQLEARQIIDRLNQQGGKYLLICDNPTLFNDVETKLLVKNFDSNLAKVYLATIIAQIFACSLATSLNNDPDNPRGLKKVTITK